MQPTMRTGGCFLLRLGEREIAGGLGLALSIAAVVLLLFSGWKGGELVFRHGMGQIGRD